MNNAGMKRLRQDFSIIKYFLKLTHGFSKSYIPILAISALLKAVGPFIYIVIPKFIIDELINQKRLEVLAVLVMAIVASNFIINLLNRWLDAIVDIRNKEIIDSFNLLIGEKIMSMDYEKIEDPVILDLKEKATYIINTQGVIGRTINEVIKIFTLSITMIGLIAVIATLDFYIIMFIILIVALNSIMYKKSQEVQLGLYKVLIPLNRVADYFDGIIKDFSSGKDIRLYNIGPMIMNKYYEYNSASLREFSKVFSKIWRYNGFSKINLQAQMAVIYAYMTYKVYAKYIGIGSFTMYVAAAVNFSTVISDFSTTFISLRQMSKLLETYLEFEQIESKNSAGYKRTDNVNKYNIEFKNVSFKYPRSNDYTLKNVSIIIKSGERLSIVGLNGAGKTTFIKLLTRLYEPTEGEILLDGINIKEYDYEEYMKLLSVVFQDFKLMAFSIKENVALSDFENSKDEEVEKALEMAGLKNDILKLSKGVDTHLYKTFEEDGIEFSGGQSQKLAIARALFKNAPIVVLDEPTAALDPIAEFEIYNRFNELIGQKTAIYISHRLTSCKICDNIAVFHNGQLIQYGNHENLIKEKGSQYENMYAAQAMHYV